MGKTLSPYKTSRSDHSLFTRSCPTLFDSMVCKMPGFLVLHCLPEFVHTHVHWVDDAIQPSCPLSPTFSCPQSFPASGSFPGSQVVCIRWPMCWSFSFSISPSSDASGWISFRTDWLDHISSWHVSVCSCKLINRNVGAKLSRGFSLGTTNTSITFPSGSQRRDSLLA